MEHPTKAETMTFRVVRVPRTEQMWRVRFDLYHENDYIGLFPTEWDATDTAIRFAQDQDALYSLTWEG